MKVLVVGGAGYIGSHCVCCLSSAGHTPVVLDNLVFGHKEALSPQIPFYQANLGDYSTVCDILKKEEIEVVMHFAAFINVGESVTNPLKYYKNNVSETYELLRAMIDSGAKKFVFSSTCAINGTPQTLPIAENAPQAPINPYGQTKLDVENALKFLAQTHDFSFAALRYFNAAGAAPDGSIGEDHSPETHLIPLILQTLLGQREHITIYGTDYDTPDGTCLRDYIHVNDLSRAHIEVINQLDQSGRALFYNLGTGNPYSVREVIQSIEKVTGKTVPVIEGDRRPGDPPALYADPSKAKEELNWDLEYPHIDDIVATAWNWHQSHPNGFKS